MTRLLSLAALLLLASQLASFGQTPGQYQSSMDGQTYELRPRSDLGLDIYGLDGRILAVLDRGKATDDFKGRTDVLATQCPQNSGKIETTAVEPGRIRMRVEVAQKNVSGQVRCHMFGLVQWRQFDFIKSEGQPVQTAASPRGAGLAIGAATASATFSQVDFTVTGAVAQGKTLAVTLSVMNEGTDRQINTARMGGGVRAAELIDDSGATHGVSLITIGNQNWYSELVSGVRTSMVLTFDSIGTVGGVLQATAIRRLTIPTLIIGQANGRVEFRNIPIQRELPAATPSPAAAATGGTAASSNAQSPELKGVQFQIVEAAAQNNVLNITLVALNQGPDRLLNTARMGGGANAARLIDDQGNTHGVTAITIGNQQWRSDLVNGIKTAIKLTFEGLPTVGGVLQMSSIARLTLPYVDIGQESGSVEFRNVSVRK